MFTLKEYIEVYSYINPKLKKPETAFKPEML